MAHMPLIRRLGFSGRDERAGSPAEARLLTLSASRGRGRAQSTRIRLAPDARSRRSSASPSELKIVQQGLCGGRSHVAPAESRSGQGRGHAMRWPPLSEALHPDARIVKAGATADGIGQAHSLDGAICAHGRIGVQAPAAPRVRLYSGPVHHDATGPISPVPVVKGYSDHAGPDPLDDLDCPDHFLLAPMAQIPNTVRVASRDKLCQVALAQP